MDNYFNALNAVNVSDHVEKKGNFSYLSWAYAIKELKSRHPDATWQVIRFDGLPYQKTELGYMVEVAVTVNGVTHSQIHPVLDSRNKPIPSPTVFDINTSIQRALVKAIALHGLGLYIYAGEDLPEDVKPAPTVTITAEQKRQFQEQARTCLSNGDEHGLRELWAEWGTDEKAILWALFNSQERSAMKALKGDA
jgi:hypothetical protein